jgi:enamine deaminase RidA (YjgF/YER057c/UK114 family)
MEIKIINPPELGSPRGYSNGILATGGSLLFVAGQVGWTGDQKIISDDFVEQFEQALINIQTVVRTAGGNVGKVVRLTIYVTDKQEYQEKIRSVGEAYRRVMGKHFPAMTLVEVKSLLEPSAKVEIEATAII